MALKEIKPYYFDENGVMHINACCSGANDDWLRTRRLSKRAKAGDKEAEKELAALKTERMFEEVDDESVQDKPKKREKGSNIEIKYMYDSVIVDLNATPPTFRTVGIWAYADGMVDMEYIDDGTPEVAKRKADAIALLNRLKVRDYYGHLPEDFLEYHIETRSIYDGMFNGIWTSIAYDSPHQLCREMIKVMKTLV